MKLSVLLAVAAVILFEMCLLHPTIAQTQSAATIHGTLTDPSGAAVVGATIAAQRSDKTSEPIRTISGPDGQFSLRVTPGRYRVSVQHASFAHVEQEFDLADGETRTLDIRLELEKMSSNVIVTGSAEPATSATTPDLVDVITKQQIDDRQAIWLTDMLAAQQGASFARLGSYGGITSFFLDGGNSNYTKVLVDGAPVNEPGGSFDFSNFTLENVDKIEIVHGASSALYGSDAMDGVIQIFTHRGTTKTPQLTIEGDGGTFGTGHGGGQISGVLGMFDYSAATGYFSTNGQGPDDFFRDVTLSGNFGWKFSDKDSLRLTLRNNASDAGQPGQTLLPGEANLGQSSDLHNFVANLGWNFSTGEHWQHQLSAFESRFQLVEVSPPFGIFKSEYNRAGLNEQSTYLFHKGTVTAGYENEVETGPSASRHNQAAYLETRYQPTRRLTLIAGGRVEANGFFGTRVVPRTGATYALRFGKDFWGATRLRASYGEGIKEPDILPIGCSPQLNPEQSSTFDAGIDQYFASDRIHMSVTYFHNDFRDIISFASGGATPNCPAFGGSYFNTDKARAMGANSSFELNATRWLTIIGNYTYDDSKVLASPNAFDPALAPGNRLFERPLHSANVAANARFLRMNWNLAGYYVGRRTDSDFDGLGITSVAGYVRLDLSNSISLGHGVSTVARFENLLDRHYEEAVGYPALGYNYRLGLKYVWGGEK
ncbi:MAG TPA: TonB-dependent receptor [Candidatus Acidoferrales bacterium]|nr:TonB-dependent receptor [Candidatus Acidoferrales bacterium]